MARFKKASADEVHARRKDHIRDSGRGGIMVKGFKAPPSWDKEQRSARFIMTSETVDRYGDIVSQVGLDLTRFNENPQGLLFHNSRSWPCGTWSDVAKVLNGRPKRTEGTLTFLPEGTDDDADRAARHVAAGTIRTVSIGFIPDWDQVELILDDEEDWVTGLRYNASELIECSLVPIPAQPDALVKEAGGDLKLARDLIEDILDTYTKTPEGLLMPLEEYRQKHLDLVVPKSFFVIGKDLSRAAATPRILGKDDKFEATTDEEAATYIGAKVAFDPSNAENKEWPASEWIKEVGIIIDSYIVDHGEFKGVHALAVEFIAERDARQPEIGSLSGMMRGVRAERFLLVGKDDADDECDPDDPLDEPDDDEATSDADNTTEEAVEEKPADKHVSPPVVRNSNSITVTVDTSDATEKLNTLAALAERVGGMLDKFFGRSKAESRVEPTIVPEVKVVPPTEAEVATTLERLAAIKARIAASNG